MNSIKIDISKELLSSINQVLEIEMEKEFDKAIKNLNERKREIVAGVLLNVMKTVDMQTIGERTIFTIKEIK